MNLHSAVFYTKDIDVIEGFYKNKLGLKLEYRQGGHFLSFIFKNDIRLGIKKAIEAREIPGRQTIFIEVEDIEATYQKVKSLNIPVFKEITQEKWATEFAILDPDGNKLEFRDR